MIKIETSTYKSNGHLKCNIDGSATFIEYPEKITETETTIEANTNRRLTRTLMWPRHAFREHRVTPEVFLDVFQQIYNTLEQQPMISLASAADQILAQLVKK